MTRRSDARGRAVRILDAVGLTATGVGVLLLLAYLIGSLILTGGQIGATLSPNYDQVVPWPLFEVPVWVAIALAVIALVTFVPMAAMVRTSEAPRILRAVQFTMGGVCVASLCWMLAFPISLGAETWPEPTPTVWGSHWIAIVIGVATVALVLILGWRKLRDHDRARRA